MLMRQLTLQRPTAVVGKISPSARIAAPRRRCNSGSKRGSICRAKSSERTQSSSANGSPTSEASREPQAEADNGGESQGVSLDASDPSLHSEQILQSYLSGRVQQVAKHFPTSLGVDDFIARIEMALYAFGFHGDNTIACSNLCRDEITASLKNKLDAVFGCSFNINGLGGVLTCGVTGVGAGLSHAPIAAGNGRERYVFFSFPHIAIDSKGTLGAISRPGRAGPNSACGAIKASLAHLQSVGLEATCGCPGEHDVNDPEFSILKQRLARRIIQEGLSDDDIQRMDIADLTKVAERTITSDLEGLIKAAVDTEKADYAVVTGVQIHNWGEHYDDDSPNLEIVAPASIYVVIRGQRTYLDITSIPGMTPRQIAMLAGGVDAPQGVATGEADTDVCGPAGSMTTVRANAPDTYGIAQRRVALRKQAETVKQLLDKDPVEEQTACNWPAWQSNMHAQNAWTTGAWSLQKYQHMSTTDTQASGKANAGTAK